MKLIIQIPSFNESETLEQTVRDIPRTIRGIDQIELLVIDDGSQDGTAELARKVGVHHIVRQPINRGLALTFQNGIHAALARGADIIVNTDADNQYQGADIPKLVAPILEGTADVVIGIRPIQEIQHFSWIKKQLQGIGSWVVRLLSGTDVRDVTSGFRAFTREAALSINLISGFSHTQETLIQMGQHNVRIAQVPIRVNPKTRESRLFKNSRDYILRSVIDLFRIYLFYRGERFFLVLGLALIAPGMLLGFRYLYIESTVGMGGHIQSLILAAILIVLGFQSLLMSFFMRSLWGYRLLLERILLRTKMNQG